METNYQLNQGQESAFIILKPFIDGSDKTFRMQLLEGYAGTGKTFLTNRIIESVYGNLKIGMTAPTHKAVRQLKKSSELKDVLEFGTIHSFLGLKEKYIDNPSRPNEMIVSYEPDYSKERKVEGLDVLIVDESSMLGEILFELISDELQRSSKLRILFIGDSIQIPPVKEKGAKKSSKLAIPFIKEQQQSRKIGHVVLTEIVRQAVGNPIIEYATAIRGQYKSGNILHELFKCTESTGVELLPRTREAMQIILKRLFDTPEFKADPDYAKVIAWRNDTVVYFNKFIRSLIYNDETLPYIVKGDKLITDKPVLKLDKILLPNNEELEVLDVSVSEMEIRYKLIDRGNSFEQLSDANTPGEQHLSQVFQVYKASVRTMDNKVFLLDIIHESSQPHFKTLLNTVANYAKKCKDPYDRKVMWREFFGLEKKFAWVKHNYALSAHKSQGSTYKYAISMEWDIDVNWDVEERNRIKYVATTRASDKLFIVR